MRFFFFLISLLPFSFASFVRCLSELFADRVTNVAFSSLLLAGSAFRAMNGESPVSLLWDNLLKAALRKPPSGLSFFSSSSQQSAQLAEKTKQQQHSWHQRQRRRSRSSKAQVSVYACKHQRGTFWCAEPCRPEKMQVKRKAKRVTFSPVVSVVEFTVTSSRWD